eukprot:TRINITY_DN448_c1_g1_i4.p1 TRINITY_DN448_c1_g1~~TRINITY_DN448_c1_g1_i4.p1  ORF type:complete len:473 (+),score=152.80 TRINITY_DN448_c1_g1_i4:121-1419(+)
MEDEIKAAYMDTSSVEGGEARDLTQMQFSICNKTPGALFDVLLPFKEAGLNLTCLTTRQCPDINNLKAITVFCDVEGHISNPKVKNAIDKVKKIALHTQVINSTTIPWFATQITDIDLFSRGTMAAGEELSSDHPGFNDVEYRKRRDMIAELGKGYRHGMKVPTIEYTKDENKTWSLVWDKLMELYPTHACKEYQYNFSLMVENCGYRPDTIPQLEDISAYLKYRTGFSIRPVTGLLTPRNFLNALAFRVFHSTQYIRHHSLPFYTPEPDVVHELMGHAVLFADPDFAEFTQQIGMASLGASDDMISKLASCYWFSVEFGLCKQEGQLRAYGAGLLGSFGELKYCLSGPGNGDEETGPRYLPWQPEVAAVTEYPITRFQPTYFVAESFADATKKLKEYSNSYGRPFTLEYNPYTQSIKTITTNSEAYLSGKI